MCAMSCTFLYRLKRSRGPRLSGRGTLVVALAGRAASGGARLRLAGGAQRVAAARVAPQLAQPVVGGALVGLDLDRVGRQALRAALPQSPLRVAEVLLGLRLRQPAVVLGQ